MRGDIFSTVSHSQGYATVGELGLIKRLNTETTGYNFCHTIPCAMDPELFCHDQTVFRSVSVPDDAFVILWSGGYNTWTDVNTLFDGIAKAMAQNPDIWFVSTGGQIDGHDEITYPEFVKRVKESPFKDRFLLKGWIPKDQVHNYYFEANIGINIDTFMYEGMFGSKNRVLDWMRAGLPSLIGELCELSYELPEKNLAYSYPLNNADALAEKILELAIKPDEVRKTGQRAQEYGLKYLTFQETTKPFRTWLNSPVKSPDHFNGKISLENHFLTGEASQYTHKLVTELDHRNSHIQELETYILHLEKELSTTSLQSPPDAGNSPRPEELPPVPLILADEPTVSVVVVCWNGEDYLRECLDSVMKSDFKTMECIVIDNASSDGSVPIIQAEYPDVVLIENTQNLGFSKGVNQGIRQADGDVLFLLNQDAILEPDTVSHLVQELIKHPDIAIAGCKIFNPDGKTLQHAGGILHENGLTDHYGAGEPDTGQFDLDKDCDYVTGAAIAIKKDLVNRMGLIDERFSPAYFEELDYCTRARRLGYRIRYVHAARLIHYESTSTGKFSQRFYYLYHRNRLLFMLKHYSARYMAGTFRRFEINWIRNCMPREQVLPVLRGYLRVIHRFGWIVIRDLIRRLS